MDQEEDFDESQDLLFSLTYGIRMFYSGGLHQEMMVGAILEETDDSFLVALPVITAVEGDKVLLEELPKSVPYYRFIKSSFRMVSLPTEIIEAAYVKYLGMVAPEVFPELIEMLGISPEEEDVSIIKEIPSGKIDSIESIVGTKSNFSSAEIKKKIEDAIDNGSLFNQQGEKPN